MDGALWLLHAVESDLRVGVSLLQLGGQRDGTAHALCGGVRAIGLGKALAQ